MTTYFDRFVITMTLEQAKSVSQPGCDASDDVRELLRVPAIRRMIAKIDSDDIRKELSEYGAWDDDELADDDANKERILWIAGNHIREESRK